MLHSRLFIYMRGISSQTVYSVSSFTVLNMEALFDSVKSSIVLDVELKFLLRVVTLTNVRTDTGYSIILLLIYFVSALTFTIRFA